MPKHRLPTPIRIPSVARKYNTNTALEPSLPSRDDILAFIARSRGRVGKREIAREFGLSGADKIALKHLLDEFAEEGAVQRTRKGFNAPGALPSSLVADITDRDRDGELVATPAEWNEDNGKPPRILVLHYADVPDGAIQTAQGFKFTKPLRTILDVIEADSASKDIVRQAIRQAFERGLIDRKQISSAKMTDPVRKLFEVELRRATQ